MPQAYPVPSWVQGLSPAEAGTLYSGGVRTGVGIQEQANAQIMQAQEAAQRFAMEQQRLAQEKEQTQMQMQLREKTLAQETERQRQQLEMTKAYHEQVTNLRQQDLEIGKQKAQQAAQEAAQSFAAQQGYQQMRQQLIDSGVPEDEASYRSVLRFGTGMKGGGPMMGAAYRAAEQMKQPVPVKAQDVEGAPGYFQVPSPTGKGYQIHQKRPEPDDIKRYTPAQAGSMLEHLPELAGVLGTNWVNEVTPALKKRVQEGLTDKIEQAKSGKRPAPPVGTVIKGHRFKGGDPADKDNWEKVE